MSASPVLFLLLSACSRLAPLPVEGDWSVTPGAVTTDDCDEVDEDDDSIWPEGYTLTNQDSGFELFETLSEIAVSCALDGKSFLCDASESSDSGSQGGDSYTVTQSSSLSGEVQSDTTMDALSSTTITCESGGTLCADIEGTLGLTFPCSVVLEFGLAAEEGSVGAG